MVWKSNPASGWMQLTKALKMSWGWSQSGRVYHNPVDKTQQHFASEGLHPYRQSPAGPR